MTMTSKPEHFKIPALHSPSMAAKKRKIDTKPYKSPVPCQESPPSAVAFAEDIDTLLGHGHFSPSPKNPSRKPTPQTKEAPIELPDDLRLLFSTLGRDAVLAYAQRLYDEQSVPAPSKLSPAPLFSPSPAQSITKENVYTSHLLPLLRMLRNSHPNHTPTMLLLSCVHYAMGNYEESLELNEQLLKLEPRCVEAMCNMGAVMNTLNRPDDAVDWWDKALQIEPTYWEVSDNMLSMLIRVPISESDFAADQKALTVCRYIQSRLADRKGRISPEVPPAQFHRFQNLFRTTSNLENLLDGEGAESRAMFELIRGLELAIRAPSSGEENGNYTFRDLIIAACIAGYSTSGQEGSAPTSVLRALVDASQFQSTYPEASTIMKPVHASGDRIAEELFREGHGALPEMMLRPDEVLRLPMLIFPETWGVLPALCSEDPDEGVILIPEEETRQRANLMTSSIFLAMAKMMQDASSGAAIALSASGIIAGSPSLILMLYYLALAFSPSASLYNNVGVVLSGLSSESVRPVQGRGGYANGQELAKTYYEIGLRMDPKNSHLLTNYASLLKDQGQISEAVQIYTQVLNLNPKLDIALTNIANAIKDLGRPWDAIPYYKRAYDVNPTLPDATCGLVNSMQAVCDWRDRGKVELETTGVDSQGRLCDLGEEILPGWMSKLIRTCEDQINVAYSRNTGIIRMGRSVDDWLQIVENAIGSPLAPEDHSRWNARFALFYDDVGRADRPLNEGGFAIRFVEWVQQRLKQRWYVDTYGPTVWSDESRLPPSLENAELYQRPVLLPNMSAPIPPSVLPFHTFMYPLSTRTIRLVSHRNALRITHSALTYPWLPTHVYPPPPPPSHGRLNVGYVSSDFNNHPLAHLMQSVFAFHDKDKFKVHLYALTPSDGCIFRKQIEASGDQFLDVSQWSNKAFVERIVQDQIHILVNLGGYTKGAKNEVFAVRPSPIQISLMGYAGTLAAGWCDYLVCDQTTCPEDLSSQYRTRKSDTAGACGSLDFGPSVGFDNDPESLDEKWMYTENMIYMPHSFFVNDHRQSSRVDENLTEDERAKTAPAQLWRDEVLRRGTNRQKMFPDLPMDFVIFANFNQLYKIDPDTFATWLRILNRVPRSILWLLRFPPAGEEHLMRTAKQWGGDEVTSRVRFSDAALKEEHIIRCRVADIFLDTIECNAHTVASDVLWCGTPILTLPRRRDKMCSRVGASEVQATGFGDEMIVSSLKEYEERAIALADGLQNRPSPHPFDISGKKDALINLRRNLYLNRDKMPLFDTRRWTRNIEKAYNLAWIRWVTGSQEGDEKSGCIFVRDDDPVDVRRFDDEFN